MESVPTLFGHTNRPEWGLAMIVWEREDKRGYLFEDGTLRVLAEPFYRFMQPVDAETPAAGSVLTRLMTRVSSGSVRSARAPSRQFSLSEQLQLFLQQYPDGFTGTWRDQRRGTAAKRPLKRHRDPAIQRAQQRLSRAFLKECSKRGDFATAWNGVVEVLSQTDLVPSSQVNRLKQSTKRADEASLQALEAVLYGDEDLAGRFEAYVACASRLMRQAAPWELTTAILALVHPKDYVCVHSRGFRTQARWSMPELDGGPRVTAAAYAAFSREAQLVCQHLEQSGLTPEDYLDVHDFIEMTTSPSAQSRMHALPRPKKEPSAPDSKDPAAAA